MCFSYFFNVSWSENCFSCWYLGVYFPISLSSYVFTCCMSGHSNPIPAFLLHYPFHVFFLFPFRMFILHLIFVFQFKFIVVFSPVVLGLSLWMSLWMTSYHVLLLKLVRDSWLHRRVTYHNFPMFPVLIFPLSSIFVDI